jgi:YfiH family protein
VSTSFIRPHWPLADGLAAICTTREGGFSEGAFASLNLGDHVADDPNAVARNRTHLQQTLDLPARPLWLQQVHGVHVVNATEIVSAAPPVADAAWTNTTGQVLAVMTADCLPVLLASKCGTAIAVAHGGWRGLAGGIVAETVSALPVNSAELIAWLGPAIGPEHFEVGEDVRAAFSDDSFTPHFRARDGGDGKYLADIFGLARVLLQQAGVTDIYGGGLCTVSDKRFFSYRRDAGITGRMAALIWKR